VYPVNTKAKSVLGVRAYPSVMDVPDEVDLAVVLVPAGMVPQVLRDAGRKGCKGAIVISAGFKEVGGQGVELEQQLREIAQNCGMAMIGPNCFGVINTDPAVSLNATFSRNFPLMGKIAFISQSGAVGVAALEYAAGKKIGFSKFISIGNKADTNENHLLEALADDPMTEVILMYVEDLDDPKEFIRLAQTISVRTTCTIHFSPNAACCAWKRSKRCSASESPSLISRCRAGAGWQLSPTPAVRELWRRMPPCVTVWNWPN
jgi:acetate---CoA ligase (ADP-forming)